MVYRLKHVLCPVDEPSLAHMHVEAERNQSWLHFKAVNNEVYGRHENKWRTRPAGEVTERSHMKVTLRHLSSSRSDPSSSLEVRWMKKDKRWRVVELRDHFRRLELTYGRWVATLRRFDNELALFKFLWEKAIVIYRPGIVLRRTIIHQVALSIQVVLSIR